MENKFGITDEELSTVRKVVSKLNLSDTSTNIGTILYDLLKPSDEKVLCIPTNMLDWAVDYLSDLLNGRSTYQYGTKRIHALVPMNRRDVEYCSDEYIQVVVYAFINNMNGSDYDNPTKNRSFLGLKPPAANLEDPVRRVRLIGGHVSIPDQDELGSRMSTIHDIMYPNLTDVMVATTIKELVIRGIIYEDLFKELNEELDDGFNGSLINSFGDYTSTGYFSPSHDDYWYMVGPREKSSSTVQVFSSKNNNSLKHHVYCIFNINLDYTRYDPITIGEIVDTFKVTDPSRDGELVECKYGELFNGIQESTNIRVDDVISNYVNILMKKENEK